MRPKGAPDLRWGTKSRKGFKGQPRSNRGNSPAPPWPRPLTAPCAECFSGPCARGLHLLLTHTGEAIPGGEASLPGAAEHPSDPAAERGGPTGGYQVALTPSTYPDFLCHTLRLFSNILQLSGWAGVKSSPTCPFKAVILGLPLQMPDTNYPSTHPNTHKHTGTLSQTPSLHTAPSTPTIKLRTESPLPLPDLLEGWHTVYSADPHQSSPPSTQMVLQGWGGSC